VRLNCCSARSLLSALVDVSDAVDVGLVGVLVADAAAVLVAVQALVHLVRALLLDELLVGVRALHQHLLTRRTVHQGNHALPADRRLQARTKETAERERGR